MIWKWIGFSCVKQKRRRWDRAVHDEQRESEAIEAIARQILGLSAYPVLDPRTPAAYVVTGARLRLALELAFRAGTAAALLQKDEP